MEQPPIDKFFLKPFTIDQLQILSEDEWLSPRDSKYYHELRNEYAKELGLDPDNEIVKDTLWKFHVEDHSFDCITIIAELSQFILDLIEEKLDNYNDNIDNLKEDMTRLIDNLDSHKFKF